jgi:nitrogenase molybdenum-iron protein alpha chain
MDANAVVLERYNAKVFKNRKEHMLRVDPAAEQQQIIANTRAIPGIMTNRGCCYAGCKGVVLGPIKDMVLITHGPVGCGFYSWGTRRNKAKPEDGSKDNFIQYCFTTDLQEPDIVFGGTKKLKKAIDEIMELMHPKTIMIAATCPVGLIGDDIQAVASEAEKEYGIRCVAYSCEGYKGVSQSAGHHIANNGLMKKVIAPANTSRPPNTPSTSSASTTSAATAGSRNASSKRSATRWSPSSRATAPLSALPAPTRPTSTWSSATAPSTTSPK